MKSTLTGIALLLLFVGLPEDAQAQAYAQAQALPAASLTPAVAATADEVAAPQQPAKATEAKPADSEEAQKKAAETKKQAEQKKQQAERLKKIKGLQFDRRPAAILKAWSEVGKPSVDESEAQPKATDRADQLAKKPSDADVFDEELKIFQRNVTLSNWPEIKHYLTDLPEEDGKALYERLLQAMRTTPTSLPEDVPPQLAAQLSQVRNMQRQQGIPVEINVFGFADVIALADVAPLELEKQALTRLGEVLRAALKSGSIIDDFLDRLRTGFERPAHRVILTKRQAARLLLAAGEPHLIGEFLPSAGKAIQEQDHEALNLLSQYFLALHRQDSKAADLEQAWQVTQAILASSEIDQDEKDEALKRAVDLAPKVRDELGQSWLAESFTKRPQRGIEIIAAIGSSAAQGMRLHPTDPSFRLNGLQLQTTAVEALLAAAGEQTETWQSTLDLLARNWLIEAEFSYQRDTSTSLGPSLQRDPFGNYFYHNGGMVRSSGQRMRVQPIKTGELLEIKPSRQWLALLNDGLRPKFNMVFAQLFLKVSEENQAFPFIEQLASTHPDSAEDLVDEFLRVWTQNHDPNAKRNRTNYYMFMYGYERKAESIPLTRSKQQRNLKELAELVKRLRVLPLGDLKEELLARAFTTCHSSAEVYRLEAIESVFGAIEDLEPKTLAELAQQMRANLIGVWRQPAVQEQNKTKRKQQDIRAEVLRGYAVASSVVADAIQKYPDDWSLRLAKAAIEHDENNYRQEITRSSEFSEKRDNAFAEFEKAAGLYSARAADLPLEEQTTKAYELWYYASLGACDLQHVSESAVPNLHQPERIRSAIEALPKEAAQRHIDMFANTLFTRMSAINPAVKFRYLENGFKIVGDHKQAREARQVFDYYKDLITEIKLESVIDGSDVVGHEEPFGVFVNIRHTREIERESGGFGRYLQNQNQTNSYNYASSGESVGEFCQDAAVLVFFSRRFASFSGTKQVNVGF